MAFSPLYQLTLIICLSLISITSHANKIQSVSIESAGNLLFYPEKKSTALVKSINHTQVPAQIAAQVASINVQLGSVVTKGQILVNLDCQDSTISLRKQNAEQAVAKAQYLLAKRNFDRAVQLKKNRHIGEAELDESEVNVTVTHEKLQKVNAEQSAASLAVNRCQVVSPFAGIVTERLISEGDYVTTGQALIKVLEKNNIEIEAQIPIDQMGNLHQAKRYYFISSGKNNAEKIPLAVKNIVDFVEPNSRSQVVTFSVQTANLTNGENFKVLAGMNGMVSWQSQHSFLPAHILTQRNGHYGIFVAKTQGDTITAEFIELPNAQEGRPFALAIAKDTEIIIDGRHRIDANTAVTVSNK